MSRPPHSRLLLACVLFALALSAGCSGDASTTPPVPPVTFAVIGDYGYGSSHERAVADLVASWSPSFVVTAGDNYYSSAGGKGTGQYHRSTGVYYDTWMKDVSTTGNRSPVGTAKVNAFFPVMGNHDYSDAKPSPRSYTDYFTLPGTDFTSSSGNERYYDFVQGPIHFFMLNSNKEEPDGISSDSKQARWLKRALAASASRWNIVVLHHPPYASRGQRKSVRWPFAKWGADAVLSGHAHIYERVMRDSIPYFVNGLGGAPRQKYKTYGAGSTVRYRADWGAQRVTASETELTFEFHDVGGRKIDSYSVKAVSE